MTPDKIEIVAVKNACTVTVYQGAQVISEHVMEYAGGDTFSASSPDFKETLPIDLALTLEDLQLDLMDAMLSLQTMSAAA